jgi:hypothetical protein
MGTRTIRSGHRRVDRVDALTGSTRGDHLTHEQGTASRPHALLEGIAPVVADGAGIVGAGKLGVAGFVADMPAVAGAGIYVIARAVANGAAIAAAPCAVTRYGWG